MDDPPPFVSVLGVVFGIIAAGFCLWCTIIAFLGGNLPFVGWHLDGGLVTGFLWLMLVDPIVMTICYWAYMLLMLPIALALFRLGRGSRGPADGGRED
jgi:hypothetical protein